ncbi:MAG: hypothetical protein QXI19_02865, partial [Candidatus Caldarchaeum sp.]
LSDELDSTPTCPSGFRQYPRRGDFSEGMLFVREMYDFLKSLGNNTPVKYVYSLSPHGEGCDISISAQGDLLGHITFCRELDKSEPLPIPQAEASTSVKTLKQLLSSFSGAMDGVKIIMGDGRLGLKAKTDEGIREMSMQGACVGSDRGYFNGGLLALLVRHQTPAL